MLIRRIRSAYAVVTDCSAYLLARLEVRRFQKTTNDVADRARFEDSLLSSQIPSVCAGDWRDRVLADIDQNGSICVRNPADASLFGVCDHPMVQRLHHDIQVVLVDGQVRLRKSKSSSGTVSRGFIQTVYRLIHWDFYIEAAALIRLRNVPGVPAILRVDIPASAIDMTYIWGTDMRRELTGNRSRKGCTHGTLDSRDTENAYATYLQISDLVETVIAHHVIPRDIHLANFVRADASGQLYIVDFNFVHLPPAPGASRHIKAVRAMMDEVANQLRQQCRSNIAWEAHDR